MTSRFSVRLALALLAMLALARVALSEPLLMVFRDKPPYSFIDKGVAKGFLLERTRRVMSRAGLDTEFREMPPKRIFLELEKNEQAVCSFGWYKLAEREKYARFSAALHQDRPHAVLAGARSVAAVRKHGALKGLLTDASLRLAVVDGVSYGPELDALILAFPGKIDRTLQSPLQVARKIAAERADFMLIDRDDFDHLSESSADFHGSGLVRIDYPDMPAGLKRYILCSQQVGEDVMRRINAAMALEGPR